jgi:hypothetical protein
MTYTFTITDPSHLAGITAARAAYNATLSLAPASGVEGEPGYVPAQAPEDHPEYLGSDQAYVQFVMGKAAESYARQYGV